MTAVALDTFKVVKRLQQAGFSEAQAEAVTSVVSEAATVDLTDLATKADLAVIKADISEVKAGQDRFATKADLAVIKADISAVKADISEVKAGLERFATKAELRSEIEILRRDTTIRLGAMTAAAVAIVAALVKFL